MSVYSQFIRGGPAAFGVMRYSAVKAGALPPTPTPVGTYEPWLNETWGPVGVRLGRLGCLCIVHIFVLGCIGIVSVAVVLAGTCGLPVQLSASVNIM